MREIITLIHGRLGLSRWQTIAFYEFDGPRRERRIACTVIADR
ncbi:YjbQ family protein [Methylomagnum sp.]